MPRRTNPKPVQRAVLSKERVVAAAVRLADESGAAAVTMRKLAEDLGVEAMSLYHHFPSKDAILDGMVDLVFTEIDAPTAGEAWRQAMHRRAVSARAVLLRHPWAVGLLDSRRNPGPATLGHHDAVLGCLRGAGFTLPMVAHAYSVLDSYIYGFVLQELSLPFRTAAELEGVADAMLERMPRGAYPHLAEMMVDHALKPGYSHANEFLFGLELILDGLERARAGARRPGKTRRPVGTGPLSG